MFRTRHATASWSGTGFRTSENYGELDIDRSDPRAHRPVTEPAIAHPNRHFRPHLPAWEQGGRRGPCAAADMAFGAASSPQAHDVSRWGNPYEKGRGHWRDNPTEIVRRCWDGGASTTPSMQV